MEVRAMRMTAKEMQKAYPNTCIGITDVELNDRQQVVSGDVKYTDKSEGELIAMAIRHTGIRPYYTFTSDGGLTMGALSV